MLPFVLLVIFGIIQFGFILNAHITVTSMAREGARTAVAGYHYSGDDFDGYVSEKALSASALFLRKTEIDFHLLDETNDAWSKINKLDEDLGPDNVGEILKATVKGETHIFLPLVSNLISNPYTVSSSSTMRIESLPSPP